MCLYHTTVCEGSLATCYDMILDVSQMVCLPAVNPEWFGMEDQDGIWIWI